jgi:hypothetical protein
MKGAAAMPNAEIRPFALGDEQLEKSIYKALDAIPEGKSGAVVSFKMRDGAAYAAVGAQWGDGWSAVIQAERRPEWDNKIQAEASVRFIW